MTRNCAYQFANLQISAQLFCFFYAQEYLRSFGNSARGKLFSSVSYKNSKERGRVVSNRYERRENIADGNTCKLCITNR